MKICVIGSNGQLGKHISNTFKEYPNFFFFSSSSRKKNVLKANLKKPKDLIYKLDKIQPSIIINCSAYTQVDKAEIEKKNAKIINASSIKILSKYCNKNDIFFIHFSTDYVYSGYGKLPWKENAKCNPINYYGYSKYEGEKFIINSNCKYLIFRICWLYGKYGKNNFVLKTLRNAKSNNKLYMVSDQIGSPSSTRAKYTIVKTTKIFLNNFESSIAVCHTQIINKPNLIYGKDEFNEKSLFSERIDDNKIIK